MRRDCEQDAKRNVQRILRNGLKLPVLGSLAHQQQVSHPEPQRCPGFHLLDLLPHRLQPGS
jgi:hypothetical protein